MANLQNLLQVKAVKYIRFFSNINSKGKIQCMKACISNQIMEVKFCNQQHIRAKL